MDAASDIPGSPVAWNGLLLTVPKDWIPATIDTRYLFFTKNDRAILECKWTPESGSASIPRKRKALEKQMQRAEGFTFAQSAVPEFWKEALHSLSDTFELLPFTHALGSGALCLHRPSNTTLLLHCYAANDEDRQALTSVLASMDMVSSKGPTPFAIADIRFTLPFGYTLRKAEFRPGHTELIFAHGRSVLTIVRATPANVVLNGQPFRAWIQDTLGVPLPNIHKDKEALPDGAYKRYLWHSEPKPSLLQRLSLFRSGGRHTDMLGTAWIVEDENKLVVVTHESPSLAASDREAFDAVWRSVGIV